MSEKPNQMQMPKIGEFSWNELTTTDAPAAEAFYTELFGWKAEPFNPAGMASDGPPYIVFKTAPKGLGVGGMMACPTPGTPAQWHAYVIVKNVDATLAQAARLGAKVLMPAMDVPEVGRVAMIRDPQGAAIGLHQPPG
ncbi:MAG TPA: VOC family protein [Verrucomicrobiae bacterium]